MIVRPVCYTDMYEEEFAGPAPVSEEVIRKMIQNVNLLRAIFPIGEIKAYQVNMPKVSIPLSTLFAYCDGGEITDNDTPLNGVGTQFTPDMTNRYLRGGDSGTLPGNEAGGSDTINLGHTHVTGNAHNVNINTNNGDERDMGLLDHTHGVVSALDAVSIAAPNGLKHMQIAFYLRINI